MERVPRYEKISNNELDRRWKAVREAMKKAGLDCLVIQTANVNYGGMVRYFTDMPGGGGVSVIFPLDDELTVVTGGPPKIDEHPSYGIKKRVALPAFAVFNFTNELHAKAVFDALEEQKAKTIGMVSPASMSAYLYTYIRKNLPKVAMRDATDMVDEIKAVKSEEELEYGRKAVELHDSVFEATLKYVRPGIKEYEILSEFQRVAKDMGSESQAGFLYSAPEGTSAMHVPRHLLNHEMKRGDQLNILIEVSGPGGFWAEIARAICVGSASKHLKDLTRISFELQEEMAKLMKPGVKPEEVLDTHNKLLKAKGYPIEKRLCSHGQGYDLVERPAIMHGEKMTLKENMFMAIHPEMIRSKKGYVFNCDNFLITKSGATRLNRTPREIFVV
jgi:Xaa-Pro aminopeptidase